LHPLRNPFDCDGDGDDEDANIQPTIPCFSNLHTATGGASIKKEDVLKQASTNKASYHDLRMRNLELSMRLQQEAHHREQDRKDYLYKM